MHWALWALFTAMLIGFAWLLVACILEPRKQRKARERENWHHDHFVDDLCGSHFLFSESNWMWRELPERRRQEIIDSLPSLLRARSGSTYDLAYNLEHLVTGPLKDRLPMKEIEPLARELIEKDTEGLYALKIAQLTWGKGKVPTDLLLVMLKRSDNAYEEEIVGEEIRPDNKNEIAEYFAGNEDWGYLEEMFPEGDPGRETYLRKCIEVMLRKNPKEGDADGIVHCYGWMKDWKRLIAFVNDEKWGDQVSGSDFLSSVEGAPDDVRDQFARWAASKGWLLGLVQCYNPGLEEEEDILGAEAVPPSEYLLACLKELKPEMENDSGDYWAGVAGDCAILLKDPEACREIADACIEKGYAATAGKLLCAIKRMEKEKAAAM